MFITRRKYKFVEIIDGYHQLQTYFRKINLQHFTVFVCVGPCIHFACACMCINVFKIIYSKNSIIVALCNRPDCSRSIKVQTLFTHKVKITSIKYNSTWVINKY